MKIWDAKVEHKRNKFDPNLVKVGDIIEIKQRNKQYLVMDIIDEPNFGEVEKVCLLVADEYIDGYLWWYV